MKNFDLKSAVIGLLLGVCVMLIVGAGGNGSSEVGRYRMMPLGYPSNICVVIDTASGRVWKMSTTMSGTYMGCPEDWENAAEK